MSDLSILEMRSSESLVSSSFSSLLLNGLLQPVDAHLLLPQTHSLGLAQDLGDLFVYQLVSLLREPSLLGIPGIPFKFLL